MSITSEPWRYSEEDVLTGLGVSPGEGLTEKEALGRLKKYGLNRLVRTRPASALSILASQFKSLIVILLIAAAMVSFIFDDHVEGLASQRSLEVATRGQ